MRPPLPRRYAIADVVLGNARYGAEVRHQRRPVPAHGHDFVEIATVLRGDCTHIAQRSVVPVRRGDVVAVRSCEWHGWGAPTGFELANLYLDHALLRGPLAPFVSQPALRRLAWPTSPERGPSMGHLTQSGLDRVEAATTALADRRELPGTAALGYLLIILAAVAEALPTPDTPDPHPIVFDAVRRLEKDITRAWTVAGLAREVGMSEGHLSRTFSTAFGAGPITVLNGLRCERAAAYLIASDDSVAEIGRKVGWADPNYFTRRFHRMHGVPPREYRAIVRAQGSSHRRAPAPGQP